MRTKEQNIALAQQAIRTYQNNRTPEEKAVDDLIKRTVTDSGRMLAIKLVKEQIIILENELSHRPTADEVFIKTAAINHLRKML